LFTFVDFVQDFVESVIALLVILNPIGAIPFFQSLTGGATPEQRSAIAKRAVLVVFVVLLIFAYLGDVILGALHITLNCIMIAGGVFILIFALKDAASGLTRNEFKDEAGNLPSIVADRIAVFPIAIPLLAGPGAIGTVILLNHPLYGAAKGIADFSTALAILVDCVIVWLLISFSNKLVRILKPSALMAVGKVMDILMGAIGISFIIRGIVAVLGLGSIQI
jgi:multiple antibiotic resistance protein